MAVEAPSKHVFDYDDEDDDGPVVFKRSNTSSSKQNQLNSEVKKASSQRSDGQSGRQASSVRAPNGQNSVAQTNKSIPPSKSPPIRSPILSPKSSNSSSKASPVRSPVVSSKASTSFNDQSKQASKQNKFTAVKEEKSPIKRTDETNSDDDDDDDSKPLSARLKGISSQGNKGVSTSTPAQSQRFVPKIEVKGSAEDPDDDAPLSARFSTKSNTGTSSSKPYGSHEKKPLASKIQQNGSIMKVKQQKSSMLSDKRPLDKGNSSDQSYAKKPKISDTPTMMKTKQVTVKAEKDDEDDHIPISQRIKKSVSSVSKASSVKQKATKVVSSSFKKINKKSKKDMKKSKYSKSTKLSPSSGDGQKKWSTLVHNGVIFPPPYKPHGVKMLYDGRPVDLTPEQEEVATMFAVMQETDYMSKPQFKKNFWEDWSKLLGRNHVIKSLDKCDFTPIYEWHLQEKEKKKQMSSEEKKALKEEKLMQEEKYMWAIVDGVKEKVGNFRVEPPGLFRGRGEHPKMGKLKRRIRPCDITINIGKDAPIPECPIPGERFRLKRQEEHLFSIIYVNIEGYFILMILTLRFPFCLTGRWKDIKHDNTVTWLAFWNDPINPKEFKYVFLAASSSLKGQSDKEKYEKARLLKDYIKNIRAAYTKDFTAKDVTKRQIAVATYLIDKLALRAGNEKDDDEADTVGCCTLKVGNVECIPPNKLKFDFLGKDSIQYVNTVEVELPVYKAIGQFQTGKSKSDDLFDELDTSKLNAHLKELMPGLTAKVFRTFNASITLDDMLNKETKDGDVAEKVVIYQRANKEVAIICNHQRSISKSHSAQMSRLTEKINELKGLVKELKTDLDRAKKGKPPLKDADGKQKRNLTPEAIEKKIAQTNVKIEKMERDMQTKEDLKTVALGTSKINYLDPRITVAWCKRHEVPIEKIFNKSLLAKFAWAMDVDPDFRF
ncbi:DNA topoisomerase 1 beta-like isoform X1 [Gossypium arboreum]|uniref:DNA topoisomerase 1 beta-like isoform X1 n=1 Tax=Gossypium arboreum TaxID=29729 RepID=UPI0022F17292|nr:DNA topoisomerase 1 beta-like isoform X1 [Gossypium arboreum]XP_052883949.1 DNA topoisomerase 1 beta-like isoform X1 [Gossypium arboreum]XP_052883950.1 DNA topoisomerase 1 beta-like isoform X1 [Gossypium arboreum]XP_052883951.1 DNA topoisomerase 1 beta-like isoform X1 [Gossypium arboreum]XP_052883952.1 DNA topoisomerase 1 beta-like isoform X1 [Gossypium arboreum]XP_052883953.1 DNA topoisomerase 1 beta-like isoform X1 [Gossypium arboreum]